MNTLVDALYQTVEKVPNDIALSFEDVHVTYQQLRQRIENTQLQLLTIGVTHKSKVVLLLPNLIDTVVLLFACNALGSTVIMMHPLSSSDQITERCQLTQATHVFFLDALHQRYPIGQIGLWYKVRVSNQVTDWRKPFLFLRYAFVQGQTLPKPHHAHHLTINSEQETAVILFSSGTTSSQKIIQLSNKAFIELSKQMELCVNPTLHTDSMLCALPFFHGFGLGISLLSTLFLGGRAILVPRISQDSLVKAILKQKPTYIAGIPYLYRLLYQDETFNSSDLSFIKQAFIGGELVSSRLIEDFNTLLAERGSQATLQVGYGTTETLTAVTLMPPLSHLPSAIGYPLKNNEIKILRPNNQLADAFEVGEIIIHGPTLMNDYLQEYDTESVWFIHDDKRYYRSLDLGYLDQNGLLYFVARKDDMIKSRGFLVNPNEIEQILYTIDHVLEVKVFNSDDEILNVLIAYESNQSIESLKKQTTHLLKQLDDWSIPRHYRVVSDIPKNDMKKINKSSIIHALNRGEIELLGEWFL